MVDAGNPHNDGKDEYIKITDLIFGDRDPGSLGADEVSRWLMGLMMSACVLCRVPPEVAVEASREAGRVLTRFAKKRPPAGRG